MSDTLACRCGAEFPLGADVCHVCGRETTAPSNFSSVRHNLYIGWVAGLAHKNGLTAVPTVDEAGNYTDRLAISMGERLVIVVVPEPPDDWTPGADDVIPVCPACSARARQHHDFWWETAHEPECAWLADPESEPYS